MRLSSNDVAAQIIQSVQCVRVEPKAKLQRL